MLRIEVILGVIASSIAILAFMARAWANIRRGNRIKRYQSDAASSAERDLARRSAPRTKSQRGSNATKRGK